MWWRGEEEEEKEEEEEEEEDWAKLGSNKAEPYSKAS